MIKVPAGTNGGVTPLGLLASILGGFIIGLSAIISLGLSNLCKEYMGYLEIILIILIASISGFFGSLIDSFLGATVQISKYNEKLQKITYQQDKHSITISGYDLLDNNQVRNLKIFFFLFLTEKFYVINCCLNLIVILIFFLGEFCVIFSNWFNNCLYL